MNCIKEIVNKIKSLYPDVEIIRDLKLSNNFIADYVIIKDFEVKSIFIPYKKLADDFSDDYVDTDLAYYYDNNDRLFMGQKPNIGGRHLIELPNLDLIYQPFEKKFDRNDISNYTNFAKLVEMLYSFESELLPFGGKTELTRLIFDKNKEKLTQYNTSSFFHNIDWKESIPEDHKNIIPKELVGKEGVSFYIRFEMSFNPKWDDRIIKIDYTAQVSYPGRVGEIYKLDSFHFYKNESFNDSQLINLERLLNIPKKVIKANRQIIEHVG
jgi:hypothetical protein